MARKIRRQSKDDMEVSLGGVIDGFVRGVGCILGLAAKLEEEGKDEYMEQGEIEGKTESGKEYKGAYGFRVKVGLNPKDFKDQKKLSAKGGSVSGGKSI